MKTLCHRARDPRGEPTSASAELAAIAGKSNDVVESLGVPYRWITSYVAGDKIYCVHEADDEDAIREHARRGGFPANSRHSHRQRVRPAQRRRRGLTSDRCWPAAHAQRVSTGAAFRRPTPSMTVQRDGRARRAISAGRERPSRAGR